MQGGDPRGGPPERTVPRPACRAADGLVRRSFVIAPANALRLDDQLRRWAETDADR